MLMRGQAGLRRLDCINSWASDADDRTGITDKETGCIGSWVSDADENTDRADKETECIDNWDSDAEEDKQS